MTKGTLLLRAALRKRNQKPAHLAAATGLDNSLVCKLVRGERAAGLETACVLFRHLGIDPCSWLKRVPTSNPAAPRHAQRGTLVE